MNDTIHIVLGPTASGKSALAIDMARDMNGVIINSDAMQSYDCLHVLTAQPDAEEQSGAPHKLYGHVPPSHDFTVIEWRELAAKEIKAALDKGQQPIIVGGTGFYIKALTEGFSPLPEIDDSYRHNAQTLFQESGAENFHALLKEIDPVMAERLPSGDTHRMIRAYEIMDATGKSLAEWQREPLSGPPCADWNFQFHAILPDKEAHIAKINSRIEHMLENGALDEVDALSQRIQSGEVPEQALVIKAHGFRPLRAYLREEQSLEEAFEHTAIETRQYAKRQRTWIRNQIPQEQLTIHTSAKQ